MAYTWFNFRASLGYIADGADGVWNGGGNGVTSTLNGLTGSWNADRMGSTGNQTLSFGPHLAGAISSTSGADVFTVTGFTAGVTYPTKILLGLFNAGNTRNAGWVALNAADDTVATGGAGVNIAINDGFCGDGAGNTNVTFAAMQSTLGTPVNITPSGTGLKFKKNTNNLYMMAIGFDLGSPAIASVSTAMMMGV